MPDYKCEVCNYETKNKTKFNRHLNCKKHINNKKKSEGEEKKRPFSPHFSTFSPHFSTFSHIFPHKNNEDYGLLKSYTCKFCKKKFSWSDSLQRHLNENCKEKKLKEFIIEQGKNDDSEIQNQQYKELLNIIEKEREDHKEQMDKMIERVGTTTINNQLNHTNNLSYVNNIELNNYGNENLSMLTDKFMKTMISFPYTAIPKMIKKIHFNDKYPENRNIRMINKKDGKLQILKKNKWTYVDKKDQMLQLIDDKNCILDAYYEENREEFEENLQNRFSSFQDKYSNNDKYIQNENTKETELVFWNSM